MNFFDRYSQICKSRGLEPCSQQMADKIKTNRSTISQWNTRNTAPKGETIAIIADVLGVSADYLLCRTNDPTDYANLVNTDSAVDYDNPDLIAEVSGPVLDELDGNVERAVAVQRATERDVLAEQVKRNVPMRLYLQLDEVDKAKAEAYIEGLLSAEKYAIKKNA